MTAYFEGVDYIRSLAYKASQLLHVEQFLPQRGLHEGSIENALGFAFHAFQDSYSKAHVSRKEIDGRFVITRIHIFDQDNIDGTGPYAKPHSDVDKEWNKVYDQTDLPRAMEKLADARAESNRSR